MKKQKEKVNPKLDKEFENASTRAKKDKNKPTS